MPACKLPTCFGATRGGIVCRSVCPPVAPAIYCRTKKILEALDAVSDDDSGATCSDSEQEQDAAPEQLPKKQKKADAGITLEDLQKQGYSSGPSVLFMKPPKEEQQTNWTW